MTKLRIIKDAEPFLELAFKKRLAELQPGCVNQVLLASAFKVKRGYNEPAFWVYELRHHNGKHASARSMDKCIERFGVLCAAARLTGWKPPTTGRGSLMGAISDEMAKNWSKSLYQQVSSTPFINKFLSGTSASKVIVDDFPF